MDFPKPLARLLAAKNLKESLIQKGYPYLKMWISMLEKTKDEIKEFLRELERPIEITETTELVLEKSEREIFSTKTIIDAVGKVEAELLFEALRQKGAFKTIEVTSMVERTKK